MSVLREWMHRLLGTFRRGRPDEDLEEELRLHLDLAAEEARRRGHDPDDAARIARIELGGSAQAMEELRARRGVPWLEDFGRDAAHAMRALRRAPGFAAGALLTLALGIGANTAIFSIVNGVLLSPLGYPAPEQLMRVTSQFPGLAVDYLSTPEYVEFREMTKSFAHVGAFAMGGTTGNGNGAWTGTVNITAGDDRPLRVRATLVDEHLLAALGVQPLHGRLFGPGETNARPPVGLGGPPIAILSYELWQAAFGGRPLVGRTVDVDGRRHEVLGIMPAGMDVMDHRTEIWLPLGVHPGIARQRGSHILSVVGRLHDGVTPEAAQVELDLLLGNWRDRVGGERVHAPTKRQSVIGDHTASCGRFTTWSSGMRGAPSGYCKLRSGSFS
jgi:hypothetical protein